MAEAGLRQFGHPGVFANTATPDESQLYMDTDEVRQLYGMNVTEGQIRFSQSLMNATMNRPSLWPEEYDERLEIPSDRQQVIVQATPVMKIISAAGRYSYGRRDRRALNQVNFDYLAAIAVFGSPPRFTEIDVDQIEYYPPTGEMWLPTGFFLINYTQLQIRYMAGFTQIPDRAKAAMAEIINTICAKGVSDRYMFQVGKVHRRFRDSGFVTPQAYDLLSPYILRSLY
jgi:hypothetical protein